jgi:hypothetical protein
VKKRPRGPARPNRAAAARLRSALAALAALAAVCGWPSAARADEPTQEPHAVPDAAFPLRIDEIQIVGLVRTKPYVVRRELDFREGDVITRDQLALAVARLWNTAIFARVAGDVRRIEGKHVLVLTLEDRWTLTPLVGFQQGGDTFFFRVGAAEKNVGGHLVEAAALYEYFDGFHGGQALFWNPRMGDRRIDFLVQVDRLVRPRPGFSDQRTQTVLQLGALYWRDQLRVALRASAFANRFLEPLAGPRYFPASTETALLEPVFQIGRVDTVRVRQKGARLELRPGLGGTTSDEADVFTSMQGQVLAFALLGERWNIAGRLRAGNVSRVPAHLELYAGGLDLIRGFPDNFVRTRALALANAEVRFTAYDSTWLAIVPTAFVDVIAARAPAGGTGTALGAGAGVRLLVPRFIATGLRADLAVPLQATFRGVTEAEQRRFGPVTPPAEIGSLQPSVGVFQFF